MKRNGLDVGFVGQSERAAKACAPPLSIIVAKEGHVSLKALKLI